MSLPLMYKREYDKHFKFGGKSFYFFDFDDNIAYLDTPIFLFNKDTNQNIQLSSKEFALNHNDIGKSGYYKDFYINYDDTHGSFKNFRDKDLKEIEKLQNKKQIFITDLEAILQKDCQNWKAPSWNRFLYATYNQRPVSLITARGHSPSTIIAGIDTLVKEGHLPRRPNYLSIFPVSHPETRKELQENSSLTISESSSIADLKRLAIRESFYKALKLYGEDKPHRFGMSDDDPKNIEIIISEMQNLKKKHPVMSFFVIRTFKSLYIKEEVLAQSLRLITSKSESSDKQLTLF